jgi:myo-inositol-hexaphosphate 3-phosphohydrolase
LNINKFFREEQVGQRSIAVAATSCRQQQDVVIVFECDGHDVYLSALLDWLHVGKRKGELKKPLGFLPAASWRSPT